MNQDPGRIQKANELRLRAESHMRLEALSRKENLEELSPEETRQALHDLQVYQIELEMQNAELLRVQGEVEAARIRYFDLYDLAPVGYCTLSTAGLILETNLTAATLLGATKELLIHQPFTRFLFKEDQDAYYLHRKRFIETGEPYSCDLRMVRQDGSLVWMRMTAAAALDPPAGAWPGTSGAPVNRIVLSDISEQKRGEEEKAILEAQLLEVQKLETLGVLAGGVAHDFNNLLTAIMGNANLGSLAAKEGAPVTRYFEAIERATLRAADLTRQLLAYAGRGKYVVTEVDLEIVVKEITQILSVSLPEQITLHCEGADRLPYVKGDATQFFQILMNLVQNASEAFAGGAEGRVVIRTGAEALDEAAILAGKWVLPVAPGRYVTLEVTDSGSGMTPEVMARAFEPFFTTNFVGRGLGLAAVFGILNSYRGGITLRSGPGQGTTIKVFLPAMQGERSIEAKDVTPTWRGEGRLLIVDDEDAVRAMTRHMAERLGFSVIEAPSAREAIETFRLHHENLALVLLDLSLPFRQAREAFQEMRRIDSQVPVVLSSGYNAPDDDSPMKGAAGFLSKPYRLAEFQGLLQRILALTTPA